MKYNDPQHIKAYEESGTYPKIHDMIYSVAKRWVVKDSPALELGSCLGLLAARLTDNKDVPLVIGFEPSKKNLELAVIKPDQIKYVNEAVNKANIGAIYWGIKNYDIKTVIARRVFPEIAERHGVGMVKIFGKAAYEAGIEIIILEGRKATKAATSALKNADLEANCFSPFYRVVESYKDVRVLERVKEDVQ